jgi:hypothetical protein
MKQFRRIYPSYDQTRQELYDQMLVTSEAASLASMYASSQQQQQQRGDNVMTGDRIDRGRRESDGPQTATIDQQQQPFTAQQQHHQQPPPQQQRSNDKNAAAVAAPPVLSKTAMINNTNNNANNNTNNINNNNYSNGEKPQLQQQKQSSTGAVVVIRPTTRSASISGSAPPHHCSPNRKSSIDPVRLLMETEKHKRRIQLGPRLSVFQLRTRHQSVGDGLGYNECYKAENTDDENAQPPYVYKTDQWSPLVNDIHEPRAVSEMISQSSRYPEILGTTTSSSNPSIKRFSTNVKTQHSVIPNTSDGSSATDGISIFRIGSYRHMMNPDDDDEEDDGE